MKFDHTQGEWVATYKAHLEDKYQMETRIEVEGKTLARLLNDQRFANAALIAAAPLLLEALIRILKKDYEAFKYSLAYYSGAELKDWQQTCDYEVRLIEKATGKTIKEILS